jgi:hypothetical protein
VVLRLTNGRTDISSAGQRNNLESGAAVDAKNNQIAAAIEE